MNLNAFNKEELRLIIQISENILYWRNLEKKVDPGRSMDIYNSFANQLQSLRQQVSESELQLLAEKLGLDELCRRVERKLQVLSEK
jgi:hypothetical protein